MSNAVEFEVLKAQMAITENAINVIVDQFMTAVEEFNEKKGYRVEPLVKVEGRKVRVDVLLNFSVKERPVDHDETQDKC